jgi:hypothetical protein
MFGKFNVNLASLCKAGICKHFFKHKIYVFTLKKPRLQTFAKFAKLIASGCVLVVKAEVVGSNPHYGIETILHALFIWIKRVQQRKK